VKAKKLIVLTLLVILLLSTFSFLAAYSQAAAICSISFVEGLLWYSLSTTITGPRAQQPRQFTVSKLNLMSVEVSPGFIFKVSITLSKSLLAG